jgi:hypothetical protein
MPVTLERHLKHALDRLAVVARLAALNRVAHAEEPPATMKAEPEAIAPVELARPGLRRRRPFAFP